jgi:hypothetical protein
LEILLSKGIEVSHETAGLLPAAISGSTRYFTAPHMMMIGGY